MSRHKPTLLIVDDEPFNLEIITEFLSDCDYHIVTSSNGQEALDILHADPDKFDAVLLDRMMPGIDGIEILKQIKQDTHLQILPVILQTAATSPEQVSEGLQFGAFYYLTKPFEQKVLQAVIATAIRDRIGRRSVQQDFTAKFEALKLIKHAEFSFHTITEVSALAGLLSQLCPIPIQACMGLTELMLNAVEHGNLGISYNEKTQLLNENRLSDEIKHRLKLPFYASKKVKLELTNTEQQLTFTITDQGEGFEWQKYLEMNVERLMHNHGRGIAIAKSIAFSQLEFQGKGNCVVATVIKNPYI